MKKSLLKLQFIFQVTTKNQLINIFKRINKEDWVFLHGEIITTHYLKVFQNLF